MGAALAQMIVPGGAVGRPVAPDAVLAGATACAGCHQKQFAQYRQTGMAQALMSGAASPILRDNAQLTMSNSGYSYTHHQDRRRVHLYASPMENRPSRAAHRAGRSVTVRWRRPSCSNTTVTGTKAASPITPTPTGSTSPWVPPTPPRPTWMRRSDAAWTTPTRASASAATAPVRCRGNELVWSEDDRGRVVRSLPRSRRRSRRQKNSDAEAVETLHRRALRFLRIVPSLLGPDRRVRRCAVPTTCASSPTA